MKKLFFAGLIITLIFSGCTPDNSEHIRLDTPISPCPPNQINMSKIIQSGDQTYLWGGEDIDSHFNITNWTLNPCQLRYGLGREAFDALIDPHYKTVQEEAARYTDHDEFIIVLTDDKPKVYPIELLIKHEVINEVINGEPVMVVYWVLADLAAVYNRTYCDTTFTFALSGYTYSDPAIWDGLNAFVFWDRETESLWWPLIDEAVSGEMLGTPMTKYTKTLSWRIPWGEIVRDYSDALVLATGQTMETPSFWTHYEDISCQ